MLVGDLPARLVPFVLGGVLTTATRRTSIATVSLSGTLEDKITAAAAAGFDGIEVFEVDLLGCPWSPAEVRRRCEDLGLAIELYQPVRDLEALPPEAFARARKRLLAKLDVAAALGAPALLVVSNVSDLAIDDDDLAAEQLHELAGLAAERGLRLSYEALAWGRHVNDYRHSDRIVAAGDHPALGLCLDSFHILALGDDPSGIRDIPAERITFVQLADAPLMQLDVLQWSRHHRCFPGQGQFDLVDFAGHLDAAGYAGPWSLEVFNDVFRQSDATLTARAALRSLRHLDQLVAGVERPRPSGVEFVEIAAPQPDAAELTEVLSALGFAVTGRHHSKPVALWERDAVSIVLHDPGAPLMETAPRATSVVSVGLASADPDAFAAQADLMLATPVDRPRGPGETAIRELDTPDGSTFLLLPPGPPELGWRRDFQPVDDVPDCGEKRFSGVDHVAVTVAADRLDEANLYYRAVLGLDVAEPLELPGTHGLVGSRAATAPGLSLIVNAAPRTAAATRRGEGRSVQHVALACHDVLATAEDFVARGGRLLPVPMNWYADLCARTDLAPEDVARFARVGMLYDRDAGGEFLHCYTLPLGGHLVIELCQRIGDYGNFGAANASVRLAAVERARRG